MKNKVWNKPTRLGAGIALCYAAWPMTASAAEVRLYGEIDAGISHTRSTRNDSPLPEGTAAVSGGLADTLFGIEGREVLAEGWFARFRLESLFDGMNGDLLPGMGLFGSAAWAGVGSAQAGELRLGRQHPVGQLFGELLEIASWKEMDLGATFKGADNYRASQAVSYLSPRWEGLRFGAGYSFDMTGSRPGPGKVPAASLALLYERGPWLFVASWDRTYLADAGLPHSARPQAWQAGVVHDGGAFRVSVAWSLQQNGYASLAGGDPDGLGLGLGAERFVAGGKLHAYMAGVALRTSGQGEIRVQWSHVRPDWKWRDGRRASSGDVATVGYVHELSPRTRLYAMAGVARRYSLENQVVADVGSTVQYMAGIAHGF